MTNRLTLAEPIYLTDRTTIETDWDCGMKRWWYKEEGGTGIVPAQEALHYTKGKQLHHDIAQVVQGASLADVMQGLEEIAPPITEGAPAREGSMWRMGMVYAFGAFVWPQWSKQFDVVMVEKELILARGPLWVATTADFVLRDKSDGRLVVPDLKTFGMMGRNWYSHWVTAIQMHIQPAAVREELNDPPKYAQVWGASKGQEKDGKLRHPYVWAYSDGDAGWQQQWKSGWMLRPVWEFAGGIEGWVEALGEEVAREQFPLSQPIPLDERLLERTLKVRLEREKQVAAVRQQCQTDLEARALYFEQRFNKCTPAVGYVCGYREACHNADIEKDPLGSGLYVKRTPHHEVELLDREAEE